MGTPRHATPADAAALAALLPGVALSQESEDRAVFVIDGAGGPVAAIALARAPDHIAVERLIAQDRAQALRLMATAEAAVRAMDKRELRLAPGSVPDDFARALGFRSAIKRVRNGPVQRARDYLHSVGVPLTHDGSASLLQTLYFRGVWAAVALLIGLGSVSAAVFSGLEITWLHIVLPTSFAALAAAFAIWQIGLIAVAARRDGRRFVFSATGGFAAAAIVAIGALVWDRAVPSIAEMWAIYKGDEALGDLRVWASPDGKTLYVDGAYGMGSEEDVRRALDQNKGIREVVLAGPGGRASVGFELYRLFRERNLATRVDGACASACTIAFLGGATRSISPRGRLGFHRASFPGMSDSDMYESNRDLQRFLVYGAKVTPEFAQHVFDTPADSIWVPTPQELLAGRVITRVNR